MGLVFVVIFGYLVGNLILVITSGYTPEDHFFIAKVLAGSMLFLSFFLKKMWEAEYEESGERFGTGMPPWDNSQLPASVFVGEIVLLLFVVLMIFAPTSDSEKAAILLSSMMLGGVVWQILWQAVMLPMSIILGIDKIAIFFIQIRYLFEPKSAEEAVMSKKEERENKKKWKALQKEKKKTKEQMDEVQRRREGIDLDFKKYGNTIMPEGGVRDKGWLGTLSEKAKERRMNDVMEVRRKRVENARKLHEEWKKLRDAYMKCVEAEKEFDLYAGDIIQSRIERRKEQREEEQEIQRKENRQRKLELDLEIARKKAELKKFNNENEDGSGPSPKERRKQQNEDRLDMVDADKESLERTIKRREKAVKDIDKNKDPELYQKIVNKYNAEIQRIMEK